MACVGRGGGRMGCGCGCGCSGVEVSEAPADGEVSVVFRQGVGKPSLCDGALLPCLSGAYPPQTRYRAAVFTSTPALCGSQHSQHSQHMARCTSWKACFHHRHAHTRGAHLHFWLASAQLAALTAPTSPCTLPACTRLLLQEHCIISTDLCTHDQRRGPAVAAKDPPRAA
jgi:hypothetical protein